METVALFVIDIVFFIHEFGWSSYLAKQITHNVPVVHKASDVERSSTTIILLLKLLKNVVGVHLLTAVGEKTDYICKASFVDLFKDT